MRSALAAICCLFVAGAALAEVREAGPDDYVGALTELKAGDTLRLAAGEYSEGLALRLSGTKDAPITIEGTDGKTVFVGRAGANTVELRGCSYVVLRNLVLDGKKIAGIDGVKAMSGAPSHHVTLEGLTIRGHGAGQQCCGISTKTPCWDWTIRRCKIERAGTGMYLGNSDGSAPFIRGVIEYCTITRPIGYCLQIKRQNRRPDVSGIPTERCRTILRYNVMVKDDEIGSDGARPNLLLGAFPPDGPGAKDLYEVYGNALLRNGTESLLQVCGRVTVHDNVFAGAKVAGLNAQAHHSRKVRELRVYHNTFVDCAKALTISGLDQGVKAVVGGNLCVNSKGGTSRDAKGAVRVADPTPGRFDPRPRGFRTSGVGALGRAIKGDTDFRLDFWGQKKRRIDIAGAICRNGKGLGPVGLDPPARERK